jgi:NAD(P)-dependent dehydrogenase (short-subunit alcohol dehydrogenase family)
MFGNAKKQVSANRYADQVVIVVGGAQGMGRITAEELQQRGAQVVVADYDENALKDLTSTHPDMSTRTLDIRDASACASLVEEVEESIGPIFRATVTAAIAPGAHFVDDSAEGFANVMRTNVEGVSNMAHAAIPRMLERGTGEFVVYGSVAGEMFTPGLSAYCTSKAAVNAFMEILAWELKDTGVLVHCARPPGVNTGLLDQMTSGPQQNMISAGIEQNIFVDAQPVVDSVEKAVDKRQTLSFPHVSARIIHWLRRLSPSLTWWLIGKNEERE